MPAVRRRNRLTPWYIGLVIVILAVIYVGYEFAVASCAVPTPVVFMVLFIVPVVYLVLMYLTLTSQE